MITLNKYNSMKNLSLAFALTLLLAACGGADKKAQLEKLIAEREALNIKIADLEKEVGGDTTRNENMKVKEVAFEQVTLKEFSHYIDVQGKVDGDEVVDINVKMPGTIQTVVAQEGKPVVKDQILATLESNSIQKNIDAMRTQYELAKTMFEKQKALWDQKIGTEIQYLQAKNQKEAVEKQMAVAQEQLDMTRIKSPINGTLEMLNVKVGGYAMPGMPVARVVNPDKLKVTAEVAESYASKIKTGNEAIIEFPDLNKSINTQISFAAKYINAASRSFTVESKLGSDEDYRANMLAILKVRDYNNPKAIVIPVNLIQKDETGTFVLIAVDNAGKKIAKRVNVTSVCDYKGMAEVTGQLKEGNKLITKGYQDLNDGEEIKY